MEIDLLQAALGGFGKVRELRGKNALFEAEIAQMACDLFGELRGRIGPFLRDLLPELQNVRLAFLDEFLQLRDLFTAIFDAAQLSLRFGEELKNLADRAAILPLQFLNRVDAAFQPRELRRIDLQLPRSPPHCSRAQLARSART